MMTNLLIILGFVLCMCSRSTGGAGKVDCLLYCADCSRFDLSKCKTDESLLRRSDDMCNGCCGFCKNEGKKGVLRHVPLIGRSRCEQLTTGCPSKLIKFELYTRESSESPVSIVVDNKNLRYLDSSNFELGNKTKVLLPGYKERGDSVAFIQMRDAYLNMSYNVIVGEYPSLFASGCVTKQIKNILAVANCTAQLLDYIVGLNYSLSDIHVIGSSIGAQVATHITSALQKGTLDRVTALDPAGFLFSENLDSDFKDAATFVDVIHTNAGLTGLLGPNGHTDFYPNGGVNQPGCPEGKTIDGLLCTHSRAALLFAESIANPRAFLSVPCHGDNVFVTLVGCRWNTKTLVVLGEHTQRSVTGTFFLTTNPKSPFGRGRKGSKEEAALLKWVSPLIGSYKKSVESARFFARVTSFLSRTFM